MEDADELAVLNVPVFQTADVDLERPDGVVAALDAAAEESAGTSCWKRWVSISVDGKAFVGTMLMSAMQREQGGKG